MRLWCRMLPWDSNRGRVRSRVNLISTAPQRHTWSIGYVGNIVIYDTTHLFGFLRNKPIAFLAQHLHWCSGLNRVNQLSEDSCKSNKRKLIFEYFFAFKDGDLNWIFRLITTVICRDMVQVKSTRKTWYEIRQSRDLIEVRDLNKILQ